MSEETFVCTACPGWGDHEYCALKTVAKDGKILRTERLDYTGPESEEGYICQKGVAAARQPYNPDRVQGPMKRVGARGEGKWERISWDQALDEIAVKLLELRDKYGADSVALWNLPASVPPTFGLHYLMTARFRNVWGGVDPVYQYGIDDGPVYAIDYMFGMGSPAMYMLTSPFNFDSSNLIIVWGANPVENQQRVVNHILAARENGAKIIDVGLIYDGTAAFADQFVAVNPGSDSALAIGMINQIVQNGWHNPDYVMEKTAAAVLVRKDNGQFYRDANGLRQVWDTDANAPAACYDGIADYTCEHPALSGDFTIDGVECWTEWDANVAEWSKYTPECVEQVTGVAPEVLKQLAYEYSHCDGKAYIIGALGLRYMNAGEAYRAFYTLAALTGQLGYPSAGVTSALMTTEYPAVLNDEPIKNPFLAEPEKCKARNVKLVDWYDGVKAGTYKALIKTSGNPVHNAPNRGMWINEIIPKLELIVDFDIWLTDTGEYADYVLPDCMPFERQEIIMSACYGHIVLQEPAIEPAVDCRNAVDFFTGLAQRVGLGEYFDKTTEEWNAMRLQLGFDYPPITAIDPPLTMDRLKKEKLVRMAIPDEPKFDPLVNPPTTASARIELYAETLYKVGHQVTVYEPPYEAGGSEKYPFQFFTGRQRFFMQSMYTDDPLMIKMSGGKPTIRINPKAAKELGIEEGEKVEVYNDRGHMVAPARLDEAVPPRTIQAWFGWRHKHYEDGMYSEMLLPLSGHEATDENPLSVQWWNDYMEQVPEGTPGNLHVATGVWDTIWDCSCNIRKVADGKEA